jgi:hypothetical protein
MENTIGQSEVRIESENYPSVLTERLTRDDHVRFFGLSAEQIASFVNTIEFRRGGVSPMFLSPGYGSNDTNRPRILMTILGNHPDTYFHEARHGLHYKLK